MDPSRSAHQDHAVPSQRFRNFSIASSSDSAENTGGHHPASNGSGGPSCASPGSSYDDLFADGQLLSSVSLCKGPTLSLQGSPAPAGQGAAEVALVTAV